MSSQRNEKNTQPSLRVPFHSCPQAERHPEPGFGSEEHFNQVKDMVSSRNASGTNNSRDKGHRQSSNSRGRFSRMSMGAGSKRTPGASSTNSVGGPMQVFVNGKNMTPQPLMRQAGMGDGKRGKGKGSNSRTSRDISSRPGSPTQQDQVKNPERPVEQRESVEAAVMQTPIQKHVSEHASGRRSTVRQSFLASPTALKPKAEEVQLPPGMTAKDLEAAVTFKLSESRTHTLFDLKAVCIASDFPGLDAIKQRNADYQSLLDSKAGSDRFVERHSQTVNPPLKDKQVMASPAATREVGCEAQTFAIYDTYRDEEERARQRDADTSDSLDKHGAVGGNVRSAVASQVAETVQVALSSPGCLISVDEAKVMTSSKQQQQQQDAVAPEDILAKQEAERVLSSSTLASALRLVERAVSQTSFHEKQLKYREESKPPTAEQSDGTASQGSSHAEEQQQSKEEGGVDVDRHRGASLSELFTFKCSFTEGRTVSSMAWNRVNRDVLAVAYGEFHFQESTKGDGLVLFWSLRAPEYPEKVIKVPSGVTAVDFSSKSPNLLAVGAYDGSVLIYNLRKDQESVSVPILDSSALANKHMDPVWQVKWVDKGPERGEVLVSVSTDGRVMEWSMKKGLSSSTLMMLKRVGSSDGIISRQSSGLSFDFTLTDSSIYLAGTEDGAIHKCSCSYNEQYLETYQGHTGPVYRIQCSPFCEDTFLSCSADWTVKLWDMQSGRETHHFQSVDLSDVVHDIAWSPTSSTIFGSVTGDGRIELWDLSVSTLDPVVRLFPNGMREKTEAGSNSSESTKSKLSQTCIVFSDNAPVLAVGDSEGNVRVFRMKGLELKPEGTRQQQAERLHEALNQ